MRQAERQRIGLGRMCQLVHERLAGEMVGRGGQGPIGALPQRRVGRAASGELFFAIA